MKIYPTFSSADFRVAVTVTHCTIKVGLGLDLCSDVFAYFLLCLGTL